MDFLRIDEDRKFMSRALELAVRGMGHTRPNPMVGAVLVKDGRIIGEGWHEVYGGPHAEVNCFAHATEDPKGGDALCDARALFALWEDAAVR